eukprot:1055565-Rhodomonas_salina.1
MRNPRRCLVPGDAAARLGRHASVRVGRHASVQCTVFMVSANPNPPPPHTHTTPAPEFHRTV